VMFSNFFSNDGGRGLPSRFRPRRPPPAADLRCAAFVVGLLRAVAEAHLGQSLSTSPRNVMWLPVSISMRDVLPVRLVPGVRFCFRPFRSRALPAGGRW